MTTEPIPRIDRQGELPLSFSQQALWFLERLSPGTPVFNVTAAVRITGPLDVQALERSFDTILERHEALRTTFPAIDGRPVAVDCAPCLDPIGLIDLSALPESQREAEARRLAVLEARRPFDLASGPLLRVLLLRLGRPRARGTADHPPHGYRRVVDGSGRPRARGSVRRLFAPGKIPSLPELPVQYADYAAWQRQYLQGAVLDDLLAYWSSASRWIWRHSICRPIGRDRRFAPGGAILASSASRPSCQPGWPSWACARASTLFMTALAALQVLLSRYSGQDDIAVGVPVANRTRPEIESLIGYFVNMLVMRTDLSGDPTFRDSAGPRSRDCAGRIRTPGASVRQAG